MKYFSLLLLLLTAVAVSHASPTRLDGMSLPYWAMEDDWESVNISPAFITRLDGSRWLMEITPQLSFQSSSNTAISWSTNSVQLTSRSSIYVSGQLAYLCSLPGIGFGIVYDPNFSVYNAYELDLDNTEAITHTSHNNSISMHPCDLSLLFGMRIGDRFSFGVKPRFNLFYFLGKISHLTNDIITYTNQYESAYAEFGSDIGANLYFAGGLVGFFGGFFILPYQRIGSYPDYYQNLSIFAGTVVETGNLKCFFKFTHISSITDNSNPVFNNLYILQSIAFNPECGISLNWQISPSLLFVMAANANYNLSISEFRWDDDTTASPSDYDSELTETNFINTLNMECILGLEYSINNSLMGRCGIRFSPFYWYSDESYTVDSFQKSAVVAGPLTSFIKAMSSWSLSCGLTWKPAPDMDLDFLLSSSPFINGKFMVQNEKNIDRYGNGYISASSNIDFSLAISMTLRL